MTNRHSTPQRSPPVRLGVPAGATVGPSRPLCAYRTTPAGNLLTACTT